MGRRVGVRIGFVGWSGAVTLALAAAGCGDNVAPKMPPPPLSHGPVQPKVTQSAPLPPMQTSVDHSPLVIAAALAAGTVVDARVLVILRRRQRLRADGHPAGAGLSRDAVRPAHRQHGAHAERVAARGPGPTASTTP